MRRLPHPHRRRVLAGTVALVSVVVLTGCGLAPAARNQISPAKAEKTILEPVAAETKRPNLLVIETDDMRWDDVRFMPALRRLVQARGLSFENSFSPYPLCCPSRSSFLTGQYAHNHEVYTHNEPYGFAALDDRYTIATVLQDAGYRTALVGKYLNGYGEQYLRSGEPSLDYVPPGWDEWYAGSEKLWDYDHPNHGGGTYSYHGLVSNINGKIESFWGRYNTDVVAEQARGVMTNFGKRKAPWFVWWTPIAPHHGLPVESDDPAPTRRADGDFTQWDTPGRPSWAKGRFDDVVRHGPGTPAEGSAEAHVKDKPGFLRKLPELSAEERRALTNVTRQRAESLLALDVQIRKTIRHLRRTGQLSRTIIMFTSDNGYYLGEHRKRQGKISLHEPSIRVPLLVVGPGVPRGRRYDPATTVDLAPTLASYAGVNMRGVDGTSLQSVIREGDRGWRRPVVTEGMLGFGRYGDGRKLGRSPLDTRGIRLGRWKLTRYSTGEAELYDLSKDPLELRNLARVPAHREVLEQLKQLFETYYDCRGSGCRASVPKKFSVDAKESERITERQVSRTNAYFGN